MKASEAAHGSGTPLQKSIVWISEELKRNPRANTALLVDQASLHFGLSPIEGGTLTKRLGEIRAEIREEEHNKRK